MVAFSKTEHLYFPPQGPEWQSVDPTSVGWDPDDLEIALQFARDHRSSAVVILHRGRIMADSFRRKRCTPNVYPSR
jgi:hypothetical protein